MQAFFQELFEYNHFYNQKLAVLFLQNPEKISAKANELMSHILNAHQIWNTRIDGKREPFKVWQIHPLEAYSLIDETSFNDTIQILSHFSLVEEIAYKTSAGVAGVSTVQDILFHVANHGTYHRGQLATELKNQGLAPIPTDFIFYKRDKMTE